MKIKGLKQFCLILDYDDYMALKRISAIKDIPMTAMLREKVSEIIDENKNLK